MEYAATREEMQKIDQYTIEEIGIPGMVLMEKAAMAACEEIVTRFTKDKTVLIVTERGNNGGDGIVVARILDSLGYDVDIYEIGGVRRASEQYAAQKEIAAHLALSFLETFPKKDYDIVIDAIFGVGLTREVRGVQREVIEKLNDMTGVKIALDTPSGIDASNGKVMGTAFLADYTITFGLHKVGLILYPGASYAGEVIVKDIGFPKKAVEHIAPKAIYYTKEDKRKLPKRKADSNKGTYGRVLVVAGSKNMSGAAYFNAKAAYRSGCGLVQIFTHESNRVILQTKLPEAILTTYEGEKDAKEKLREAAKRASVIVFGSGMGNTALTRSLLLLLQQIAKVPIVLDADGINCIHADEENWTHVNVEEEKDMKDIDLSKFKVPCILTPHMREMARLMKMDLPSIKENIIETAKLCVKEHPIILVLKDTRTVVMDELSQTYINITGNDGMAKGGSGDVLAGIIAGLLSGGLTPIEAARMGVFCHGMAGDFAKKAKGTYGMLASDIIEQLPSVLRGE